MGAIRGHEFVDQLRQAFQDEGTAGDRVVAQDEDTGELFAIVSVLAPVAIDQSGETVTIVRVRMVD